MTGKKLERFQAMYAPLFASGGEETPPVPPVVAGSDPAPLEPVPMVFQVPASVEDCRETVLRVAGPSPLIVEAYQDLHATAEKLVEKITRNVSKPLSDGARRLFGFLVLSALGNLRSRGLSRLPDVAVLHLPADLLAMLLGVHRSTVWRWALELGEEVDRETGEVLGAQLVARWDHKTTSTPIAAEKSIEAQRKRRAGKSSRARCGVSDGLLWAVSLTGPRRGLRVPEDALSHQWRDLAADSWAASKFKGTESGLRTAHSLTSAGLQQSLEGLKAHDAAEIAVRWTVNPGFQSETPLNMTVARRGAALGAVWDVQSVRGLNRTEQGAAVDSAAQYLAALYGDSGSIGMYRWVLWRLLRLEMVGVDLWDIVLLVMDQVRGDLAAGDCTNAGALLMFRLKARPPGGGQSLWDRLKDAYQLAPRWDVRA